jgi:hypothetical protein
LNKELVISGGEDDVNVPIKLIAQDKTEFLDQALKEWSVAG